MTRLPDLEKTTLLFVGEVMDLGIEPRAWSGRFAMYQTVNYRIHSILKGQRESDRIEVRHAVVKNSPTARADRPGLSQQMFARGARLIVGVDKSFVANYVQAWSTAKENEVREALITVGNADPQ